METNYTLVRIISIITFIYIIRLIYSHKLKIGHSWFLFLLGIGFLTLSVWPGAIDLLQCLTGSTSWLSNVLFFLLIFLFIIVVHCTIAISALTIRVKELGQQIAISFAEIDEKNLNKLINSLQTINSRITHNAFKNEDAHESVKGIAVIHDEKKLYAEQLNRRLSTKNKDEIKTDDKVNDTATP